MFGVTDAHPVGLRARYRHVGRRRAKPGLNFLEAIALGAMLLVAMVTTT
jgi:hypothetical protein